MWGRCSGAIPMPVSATATSTKDPVALVLTSADPPGGVYWSALPSRFVRTCTRRSGSPSTGGRSPAGATVRVTPFSSNCGRSRAAAVSTRSSTFTDRRWRGSWPASARETRWRTSGVAGRTPSTRPSAYPAMLARGVRSSWATSAMRSRRRFSVCSRAFAIPSLGDPLARLLDQTDGGDDAPRGEQADRGGRDGGGADRDEERGVHGAEEAPEQAVLEIGAGSQRVGHGGDVLAERGRRHGEGRGPQHRRSHPDREEVGCEELPAQVASKGPPPPHRGSSSNRYPTPRTVWMNRGRPGSSPSLWRIALMCASTTRVSPK